MAECDTHPGTPASTPVRAGLAMIVELAVHDAAMPGRLLPLLQPWARSADLYAVVLRVLSAVAGSPAGIAGMADLATLVWRIDRFAKPTVALLEGAQSATAFGLSAYATHRVAGDGYSLALVPQSPGQGLPLGGAAHLLARLPAATGAYLALTGHPIGQADAHWLGLVTHVVPSVNFAEVITQLSEGQPVDPLLDGLQAELPPSPLAAHAAACARCFSAGSLADITAALQAERGASAAWAQAALASIQQSPAADQVINLRLLRSAATGDVRDSVILAWRCARWRQHNRDAEAIPPAALFSAAQGDDLALPTSDDIASGRF